MHSFDTSVRRMGFACKLVHPDRTLTKKALREIESQYTERATTVAWLDRQDRQVAEQRIEGIIQDNLQNAHRLVEYVSQLPRNLRMVRLGSNIIPMATEPRWRYVADSADMVALQEQEFARIGDLARERDVRLSFHPGQFCCIVSDHPDVVDRTIDELEYHANMIRMMGYGQKFQDFKCNIHLSGRLGAAAFESAYYRISSELRNTLTIENDEFCAGLDDVLLVSKRVPIVLDIHHHLIRDEEYISINDPRIQQIQDSWRDVRPVIHYSYSRDEHLPVGIDNSLMPDMKQLLEKGYKKQKLRAHSDLYPNQAVNKWAFGHAEWADCMCECKMKNLGAEQLWKERNNIIQESI